jgi:hypothetical protein
VRENAEEKQIGATAPEWRQVGPGFPQRTCPVGRFRWLAASHFCGLFTWYVVQVQQTKYLMEVGFDPTSAAWPLLLGESSRGSLPNRARPFVDRIGRGCVWSIGNGGFVLHCTALLTLSASPNTPLLWVRVVAQGTLGYS